MKAAIYNPYLDTLGGGERYTMMFARLLVKKGYQVDVQWKDKKILKSLENRFGMGFAGINIVKNIKRGDSYDLCFWLSDGSIPLLKARKNVLHFQFPFKDVNGKTLMNKMKLFRINTIVCNSNFTKSFIDREYGVNSVVVYPPVDVEKMKPKRRENLIIAVGRFSQLTQSKRQDILISAFKKLYNSGYKDWNLVLAGGVEVGVGKYLLNLTIKTEGYPIKISKSPSFEKLVELYGKAKIYWSASGYGENKSKDPKKVEHFGISVVEAMAAQTVPLVYDAGGHRETVHDGENGFLWKTTQQLVSKTKKLIGDPSLYKKISVAARKDSQRFSNERFEKEFSKYL